MPGGAATSRAPGKRPAQGSFTGLIKLVAVAKLGQPVLHYLQVLLLIKGVKRQPESKSIGQGDALFDTLAKVNFAILVAGRLVVAFWFRH